MDLKKPWIGTAFPIGAGSTGRSGHLGLSTGAHYLAKDSYGHWPSNSCSGCLGNFSRSKRLGAGDGGYSGCASPGA